jgi:hypothetical protein
LEGNYCGLIDALSQYSPEGMRNTMEYLSEDSPCPSWDSNQTPPEYEAGTLPLSRLALYVNLCPLGNRQVLCKLVLLSPSVSEVCTQYSLPFASVLHFFYRQMVSTVVCIGIFRNLNCSRPLRFAIEFAAM